MVTRIGLGVLGHRVALLDAELWPAKPLTDCSSLTVAHRSGRHRAPEQFRLDRALVHVVAALADLVQEPDAALRRVENLLQQVAGRGVTVPVAHRDGGPLAFREVQIVPYEPLRHLRWRDQV